MIHEKKNYTGKKMKRKHHCGCHIVPRRQAGSQRDMKKKTVGQTGEKNVESKMCVHEKRNRIDETETQFQM